VTGPARLVDDATLDGATAHYARPRDLDTSDTTSVLVFRIGGEWLAMPTGVFDRVSDVVPVHTVPHRRLGLSPGLVTVDGDLVVHLSLGALLHVDGAASPAAGAGAGVARLVVLADARGRLAITVDEVWGVYHYRADELRPVPSTLARALVSYTRAMLLVEGRVTGVLDGPRVLDALSEGLA